MPLGSVPNGIRFITSHESVSITDTDAFLVNMAYTNFPLGSTASFDGLVPTLTRITSVRVNCIYHLDYGIREVAYIGVFAIGAKGRPPPGPSQRGYA